MKVEICRFLAVDTGRKTVRVSVVLLRLLLLPFVLAGLGAVALVMIGAGVFARARCAVRGHDWNIKWSADKTEARCRRCSCVRVIWYPSWPRGRGEDLDG